VHLVYTCYTVKVLGHSSDKLDHTDDQHTALGRTLLPQTLNSLLKATFHGEKTPPSDKRGTIFEILRVGANLCMDHGTFPISKVTTPETPTASITARDQMRTEAVSLRQASLKLSSLCWNPIRNLSLRSAASPIRCQSTRKISR